MIRQPLAALGEGLGVGEHLAHPLDAAASHQRVPDRQHQGSGNRQLRMLPERIQTRRDPSLHGIFDRHHGGVTVAGGQGLDHRPDPQLGHQVHIRPSLQLHQVQRCLLPVGADRAEKGNTHHICHTEGGPGTGR